VAAGAALVFTSPQRRQAIGKYVMPVAEALVKEMERSAALEQHGIAGLREILLPALPERAGFRSLANRDVIGQAKGSLIERHRITADEAFGYLAKASQDVNMKLTAVAGHLVETGELLSLPHTGR
jgi:hypothetical protein